MEKGAEAKRKKRQRAYQCEVGNERGGRKKKEGEPRGFSLLRRPSINKKGLNKNTRDERERGERIQNRKTNHVKKNLGKTKKRSWQQSHETVREKKLQKVNHGPRIVPGLGLKKREKRVGRRGIARPTEH